MQRDLREIMAWQAKRCGAALVGDVFKVCRYYSCQDTLIRNRKAGPGWISRLTMAAFDTNVNITTPEILVFPVNLSLHFLFIIAWFLIEVFCTVVRMICAP